MPKPESNKKQLRNIFEESLKEISLNGTDPFRRAVAEVLEGKDPEIDANTESTPKEKSKHSNLKINKI